MRTSITWSKLTMNTLLLPYTYYITLQIILTSMTANNLYMYNIYCHNLVKVKENSLKCI